MSKLTLSAAKKLASEGDIRQIQRLDASNKSLVEVGDLSPCLELVRLDLSHNAITSLGGVVHCTVLTWLDLSHNQLDSLVGIRNLVNLVVLRASHNSITACGDLSTLTNLKALILSHNQLSSLQGLSHLKQLNTLVLSHNLFETVCVKKLQQLTKLSVSHNSVRAVPDTQFNSGLRELRLNDNKIWSLPDSLKVNTKLKILDLGNNRLRDSSVLEPLRSLKVLVNLNLKGNRLCEQDGYSEEVLGLRPSLTVLDGKKREKLSEKKTTHESLLGKRKKKQEDKQEEEEEDVAEKRVCSETSRPPCGGEMQEENQESKTRKKKTKMTATLVAERDQPVAKAASGTRRKKHAVSSEESTESDKDRRFPVGRAEDLSAPLGKSKGTCSVEEARMPQKKKRKTVQESDTTDTRHYALSITSSATAKNSPGPPGPVSDVGLLTAEQQSLKKGLKGSLKDMRKGRSGVVAVKDIKKKRKGRGSGGWDPASLSSGPDVFQIGSGQSSTWT